MIVFYGNITGIHGLKGEIEIYFHNPLRLNSLPKLSSGMSVFISESHIPYKILEVKTKPRIVVLTLDKVSDIDTATKLRGESIFIDTADLPELDDDTFYESELVGFKIIDSEECMLGEVQDCYIAPASAILEVKLTDSSIASIPFVHAYFGDISRENKTIVLIDKNILP